MIRSEEDLSKRLRELSQTQQDLLLLLHDNNGICHFERLKRHIQGRREPRTSIKSLQARALVSVTYEAGDWGCMEIKYVRLTSQGQQMVALLS